MTDLKDRMTLLLAGEPAAPDDLDAIVGHGRGARRRRSVLTGAATMSGTAALAVAVVVPLNLAQGSTGAKTTAVVATQPPPTTHLGKACREWQKHAKHHNVDGYLVVSRKHHGRETIYTCRIVKQRPRHP